MRWTFVDPHGLDVVLEVLAKSRVNHAHHKLHFGSFGKPQPSILQTAHHTKGVSRHVDISSLLVTRYIDAWRQVLARAARKMIVFPPVFVFFEDQ